MAPRSCLFSVADISSKHNELCVCTKFLSPARTFSAGLYAFTFCTVLLLIQTSSFQAASAQEVIWSYVEADINETSSNASDSMTTISWLQLMNEDAEDNASYALEIFDETTISWLDFMEIDAMESGSKDKKLARFKREDEKETESGSGEGSGADSTTEAPPETTGPTATQVSTFTAENDEGSGVTTMFETTFTATEVSSSATNILTTTTYEDTTVSDESETSAMTFVPETTFRPTTVGVMTTTFTTDASDFTMTGSGETESSTIEPGTTTARTTATEMDMTITTNTADSFSTLSETESTLEPVTTTYYVAATTSNNEATESTEGSTDIDTTTATDNALESRETTAVMTTNVIETSAATSPSETVTSQVDVTKVTSVTTTESRSTPKEPACSMDDDSTCPANQYCIENPASQLVCVCVPGFTSNGADGCTPVKEFGGELHINESYNNMLSNSSSDLYKSYEKVYRNFLMLAFSEQYWYKDVIIVAFVEGSTVVQYELEAEYSESVNSSTIQTAFAEFLQNTTYFPTCSCEDDLCDTVIANVSAQVFAYDSCASAGTVMSVVCESPDNKNYCVSDTTDCVVDSEGSLECACKYPSDFQPSESNRTCASCTYQASSGCNEPFGACQKNGLCSCTWGFQGRNCTQVWLFTLVVALCGLVLIALVVVVIVCWRRRRNDKGWDESGSMDNPYVRNKALSRSMERHKTGLEWDDTIRGIIPTSYKKTTNEFESYDDSTYANVNARDFTEPLEDELDQPPPLSNWRASDLSNGNRMKDNFDLGDLDEYTEMDDSGAYFQQTKL